LEWLWEIKLDGYRALAVKSGTGVTLFSRRRKSLNRQFPYIVEALADLPAGTVVDGEVVAIDESGRPDFNLLQNFRAEASRIQYYIFDVLCWKDRDLTRLPLIERRALLKSVVVLSDKRIRISDYVEAAPKDLLSAVREQGLEGIIGKRKDSLYQPGKRSGAWIKHRVNRGQEFVIGGYFSGPHGFDSLILGYYEEDNLVEARVGRSDRIPGMDRRRQVAAFEVCRASRRQESSKRCQRARWRSRVGLSKIGGPGYVWRSMKQSASSQEASSCEVLSSLV